MRNEEWGIRDEESKIKHKEWGIGNEKCGMGKWGMEVIRRCAYKVF